jgi:hypothetical protein
MGKYTYIILFLYVNAYSREKECFNLRRFSRTAAPPRQHILTQLHLLGGIDFRLLATRMGGEHSEDYLRRALSSPLTAGGEGIIVSLFKPDSHAHK